MSPVIQFLDMGGYARYVWPAYGLTAVVLLGMLIDSAVTYRRTRRALAAIEATRPRPRR